MKELKEFNEFEQNLIDFKKKYENITYNLSDPKQEKQARSDRFSIGKICSKLKAKHKEIKAPVLELSKKIDARKNELENELRAVQNKIGDQIEKHENAIIEHQNMLSSKLNKIRGFLEINHSVKVISSDYLLRITALENIEIDESYENLQAQSIEVKEEVLSKLKSLYESTLKAEKDAAELEELRKLKAENERKERERLIAEKAAEDAKLEAERAAKAELERVKQETIRLEAEKENQRLEAERVANIKLAKAKAEAEKIKQEKEQAIINERLRIEREQEEEKQRLEAIKAAEDAKKAKQAHRAKIHKQAKDSLIKNGIGVDVSVSVISLIKDGLIKNIRIEY